MVCASGFDCGHYGGSPLLLVLFVPSFRTILKKVIVGGMWGLCGLFVGARGEVCGKLLSAEVENRFFSS